MGALQDAWDDISGKTARREAERQAEEDRLRAQNDAAKARAFSETEGQGFGSVGQVSLGVDDEELDTKVKTKKNLYL